MCTGAYSWGEQGAADAGFCAWCVQMWAAMCTGKHEEWGDGHVSQQSRGYIVVSS
jgi:hypothetical protein